MTFQAIKRSGIFHHAAACIFIYRYMVTPPRSGEEGELSIYIQYTHYIGGCQNPVILGINNLLIDMGVAKMRGGPKL